MGAHATDDSMDAAATNLGPADLKTIRDLLVCLSVGAFVPGPGLRHDTTRHDTYARKNQVGRAETQTR